MASIPWVEKYRPATIDDVAQQEEVINTLRTTLKTGQLPNLMFYGPPGTGKTSVALALVRQLFGENWRQRVKEMNASDERGIQSVRDNVKTFAKLSVNSEGSCLGSSTKYRVVILDEADSMTHDAQACLRRIMEEFVDNTRFIVICNYVSKIIEPLHSRCSKFLFKLIDDDFQKERLLHICKQEAVKIDVGALDKLIRVSRGDLRSAVTYLQSAAGFYDTIDEAAVDAVASVVPDAVASNLFHALTNARSTENLQSMVRQLSYEGYGAQQVIEPLLSILLDSPKYSDLTKARISTLFSLVDERLNQGCDEEIQLLHLFSELRSRIQGPQ